MRTPQEIIKDWLIDNKFIAENEYKYDDEISYLDIYIRAYYKHIIDSEFDAMGRYK